MTSIVNAPFDPWPGFVAQALEWGSSRRVAWRDAVFMVPTAQHLPSARRAWAGAGGWMPRVETTLTLARALAAPAAAGQALGLSFDVSADRLAAAALLDGQAWADAWARSDPGGWAQALDAMVGTAHAFWHAAAAVGPAGRDGWWRQGRAWMVAATAQALREGPGGAERALARVAFEWAQAAVATAPPPTDRLFELSPTAWIAIKAGGADPLTVHLLAAAAAASTPCLTIDADPAPDRPFRPSAAAPPLQVGVCGDFEDEAQRAAAQVLSDLAKPDAPATARLPVALISLDRRLVRRIRALLARRGVAIADETGWTLSTTRAAASLMGLLAAVQPQASTDELLNGLQACADGWPGLPAGRAGLAALDAAARRFGWRRAAAVDAARLSPAAAALWRVCRQAADRFDRGDADVRPPLGGWLDRLRALLEASGLGSQLSADEAGRQVLGALDDSAALLPPVAASRAAAAAGRPAAASAGRAGEGADPLPGGALPRSADHPPAGTGAAMTRTQFVDWIDRVLEAATFVPPAPADAQVVITPLQRAPLRPFAAVVLPGADARHLGGPPPRQHLLSDAEAAGLGLPDGAARRERETLAFAQLLRGAAPLTVLHRRDDAGEPLAASSLLARALLARAQHGVGWLDAADHRVERPAGVRPAPRPLPVAPALLPARISASACEALRACPYRFFALRVLGLQESPELDDAVAKRDYGSWLHAVLHRFHVERAALDDAAAGPDAPAGAFQADAAAAQLRAVADALLRQGGLDAASFLPYRAGFERFVPRYVEWLRRREAAGARWLDGEREFSVAPAGWNGTLMHGVIDRIDGVDGPDGPSTQLIDYKTGAAQTLREGQKRPQEDTQLAFYAGLLMTQSAAVGGVGDLRAMYLALDESDGLRELPHADVEFTAQQLIRGIGGDLLRLRAGAAMPALGEGSACRFCAARGLCRRDQWAAD